MNMNMNVNYPWLLVGISETKTYFDGIYGINKPHNKSLLKNPTKLAYSLTINIRQVVYIENDKNVKLLFGFTFSSSSSRPLHNRT